MDESHARAVAGHFDADYYLAANPDVREHGVDPLAHFLTTGWREGRNPSAAFDVTYYLRCNPDVAAAGINPLLHYAWAGQREGRLPLRPMDAARRAVEEARPPRERAREWAGAADHSPPLGRPALARGLAAAVRAAGGAGLVVSVGHDDYELNAGGVQNAIRHERQAFERMGWAHLHASPAAPLPGLAEPGPAGAFRLALRLGPDRPGVAAAEDLTAAVAELRDRGAPVLAVVHHLMGHRPEALVGLARLSTAAPVAWAHDYFAVCPNHNLMRNDIRFCGAPPPDSPACGVCAYGEERAGDHLPRVRAFFEAVRPVVLAPSRAALDLWLGRSGLPCREAHVQPLARLVLSAEPRPARDPDPGRPLRVAHLGYRLLQKGWRVFEELAARNGGRDGGYAFYQLGGAYGGRLPGGIRHVPVQVTRERPDAMVEALAQHRIDVVVSWSLWPETFCFAAHEALAAGAFLLARAGAGNVAPALALNAPEQGLVVEDEAALHALFADGSLARALGAAPRPRRGVLIPEGGTAAWFARRPEGRRGPAPAASAPTPAPAPRPGAPQPVAADA